jgi:hypothetical protein
VDVLLRRVRAHVLLLPGRGGVLLRPTAGVYPAGTAG